MRNRDSSINRNVSFSILGGDLIRTVAARRRPDIPFATAFRSRKIMRSRSQPLSAEDFVGSHGNLGYFSLLTDTLQNGGS